MLHLSLSPKDPKPHGPKPPQTAPPNLSEVARRQATWRDRADRGAPKPSDGAGRTRRTTPGRTEPSRPWVALSSPLRGARPGQRLRGLVSEQRIAGTSRRTRRTCGESTVNMVRWFVEQRCTLCNPHATPGRQDPNFGSMSHCSSWNWKHEPQLAANSSGGVT